MKALVRTGMVLMALAFLPGVMVLGTKVAEAASVTPIFVSGNPTCASQGYNFEFKVDPPNTGTYPIPNSGGKSVTITLAAGGKSFDWTSSLGVDAVISKGGPNAYLYVYNPPAKSLGDTNLVVPNNLGVSHVNFCFNAAPTATYLASIEGIARVKKVKLKWTTANELPVIGFNVYRSNTKAGPYRKLNTALVPANAPGSMKGSKYVFKDSTGKRGKKYFYRVEVVQSTGSMLEMSKILKLRKPPLQ